MRRRAGIYSLASVAVIAVVVGGFLVFGMTPPLANQPSQEGEATEEQATPQKTTSKQEQSTQQETIEQEEERDSEGSEQASAEERQTETEAAQREAEQQAAEQAATEQRAAEQAAAERQDGWRDTASYQQASEQEAVREEQPAVETAAPTSAALSLTVPRMGLYNDPVSNSIAEGVLAQGAGKIPSSGFPWQAGANTYIAAHVYGYPGTGSWQQFAALPSMARGDAIYLTDSEGTTYEYRVTEVLTVAPTDVWVAQSTGTNMVSLQTCVGPGWSERLVVRAEMV